jgi:hypothetical protein
MKKTLLTLALATFAGTALADSLIYGGASVGQSDSGGDTSTSTNIHIGTGILPFIGIEGGYTDHGTFDVSSGVEKKVSSMYAAVRPSIDIGPLNVYARGGLHQWDSTTTGQPEDDGTDLMYGVGASMNASDILPITLGVGFEVYEVDGGDDIEQFNINLSFNVL